MGFTLTRKFNWNIIKIIDEGSSKTERFLLKSRWRMKAYSHKVQYYETDKMGITHHSNYIRWIEQARIDFFSYN